MPQGKVKSIQCIVARYLPTLWKGIHIYIATGTMGNMLGRYGFTKEALKQWHEWYIKKHGRKQNKKKCSI